jgi:hypothetical protein
MTTGWKNVGKGKRKEIWKKEGRAITKCPKV